MKQIAVILYEGYCLCEITVALEMLRMADIPVTYFGVEKKAYRSEEGIVLQCEHTLDELDVDDYDGILLSGFMEENPTTVSYTHLIPDSQLCTITQLQLIQNNTEIIAYRTFCEF